MYLDREWTDVISKHEHFVTNISCLFASTSARSVDDTVASNAAINAFWQSVSITMDTNLYT